ncbi:PA2169 family four-helix-bundle protein [Rhodobacteraceae bacterium CCMM004]|nr:PA2169 family four-helix-bundle protein [Rhodobacteraceae bacterium CCMM004]
MSEEKKVEKLHSYLVDSRDGYEAAAERLDNPAQKTILERLKGERAEFAAAIRTAFSRKDVDLEADGSILASMHRAYLGVKDAVTGGDEQLFAEILRGELKLREVYDEVLAEVKDHRDWSFLKEQRETIDREIAQIQTEKRLAA